MASQKEVNGDYRNWRKGEGRRQATGTCERGRERARESRLIVRRRWKSRNEQQLPDLTVARGVRQGRIFHALETASTKLRGLASGSHSGFTNRGNSTDATVPSDATRRRGLRGDATATQENGRMPFRDPPRLECTSFFSLFLKMHSTRRPEKWRPSFASLSGQLSLPLRAVCAPLRAE